MKKILLVKTSSMGDVVHGLPVIADIRSQCPEAEIDWVVEESFAAIPAIHPGLRKVLQSAVRRWRTAFWRKATRDEIGEFVRKLRSEAYDCVVDMQGLLKSACIARAARGRRYGLDWKSSREPLGLFYDRTFSVPWSLHAVERNRALAGLAIGYRFSPEVNYGIAGRAQPFAWLSGEPYVVLLHGTSARRKQWPESSWRELGLALRQMGTSCVLPWGSSEERARSERLAGQVPGATVPPFLELREMIGLLSGAKAVAGVDTGLTHLAAALGIPTIGIYCATDPARTGIYRCPRAVNVGGADNPPMASAVLEALMGLDAR